MKYTFTEFTKDDIPVFSEWLKDKNIKKHIFIEDVQVYRMQSENNSDYRMFSVYRDSELVAHFSGERCGRYVSVCLIVKPKLHGKGIGAAVIREAALQSRKLFGDADGFTAHIFNDNPASKRCFEKAGFELHEKTDEDERIYRYTLREERTMNEVTKKMLERRSVRKYTDKVPSDEVIGEIINAGTYAASGMNRQDTIIVAIKNRNIRDELARDNASFMGSDRDPFYGAPVVLVVLARKSCPTGIYDGSLVMANLMLAAHSLGVSSCWIHRAKETFEMPKWKQWLRSIGAEGEYEGIGNCILGYCDGEYPTAQSRKEGRVFIAE